MSKILNIVKNMDKEQDRKQVTMTDKQIIIDGVDVLKEKINMCFILLSHKLETSETIEQTIYDHLDVFVEEWNNQLKRKEQECEELKKNVAHWKMEHKEAKAKGEWTYDLVKKRLGQQLDQLKAENDELKQKCNIYTCGICGNKEDCNKLYKTLTEIKEISKAESYLTSQSTRLLVNNILQKINECEVK